MRFANRVAFVTGAGSGIGRATARLFAAEGAAVFAVDVNEQGVAQTVDAIRQAAGTADGLRCDVTSTSAVEGAVARAVAVFGGINVLINAAGIGRFVRFEEMDEAEFERTLAVNLGGAFRTMKAALPQLLRPPVGNVVNVASTASFRGNAYASAYAASKAALLNFSRSLALEFASRDLRVNCVCPGGVKTPLVRGFMRREDFEQHLIDYQMPPKAGTFSEPDDIAKAIAFLASDDARFVNGAGLLVDSGTLA